MVNNMYPAKTRAASRRLTDYFLISSFDFLHFIGRLGDHGRRSSKNDRSVSSWCCGITSNRCSKYSYGLRLFSLAVSAML